MAEKIQPARSELPPLSERQNLARDMLKGGASVVLAARAAHLCNAEVSKIRQDLGMAPRVQKPRVDPNAKLLQSLGIDDVTFVQAVRCIAQYSEQFLADTLFKRRDEDFVLRICDAAKPYVEQFRKTPLRERAEFVRRMREEVAGK